MPISIVALNAEALELGNVQPLGDLGLHVPNIVHFRFIAETSELDRNGSARTLEEIRLTNARLIEDDRWRTNDQITQEFQLQGTVSDRINYVAGLYLWNEYSATRTLRSTFTEFRTGELSQAVVQAAQPGFRFTPGNSDNYVGAETSGQAIFGEANSRADRPARAHGRRQREPRGHRELRHHADRRAVPGAARYRSGRRRVRRSERDGRHRGFRLDDAPSIDLVRLAGWMDDYQRSREIRFQATQEAFGLLGARLVYEPPGQDWRLSVFGTNLTDEQYLSSGMVSRALSVDATTVGRPREVGASLQIFFD